MNTKMVVLFMVIISCSVVAMDNKKDSVVDIRKFGLEFSHDKQDEHKNTFWHTLAQDSARCEDWSQITAKMEKFKQNNNNWLPNPMIKNDKGNLAKKEAREIFNKTGNPVSGLLFYYLAEQEKNYLNVMSVKQNRETMAIAQQYPHPNGLNKKILILK